tara:strand:- start:1401 stop:1925 length:525 start_codon:yes stop_codon:yes gene_type:complete
VARAVADAGLGLVGGGLDFSIDEDGLLVFSGSVQFSVSFTGNTGARLGFGSDSGLATTHSASSVGTASVYPFSADAIRYTLNIPSPSGPGFSLYNRGITKRTPGTDWKFPEASVAAMRETSLRVIEAIELADTPGKISILIEPSSVIEHHLGSVKVATQNDVSGWTATSIEVIT